MTSYPISSLTGFHPSMPERRARREVANLGWLTYFLIAHVPVALAMHRFPQLATLHALATLAFGLWWTKFGRHTARVACVGGYIVGAEVLWRMTEAHIFWEGGKYALAVFMLLGIWNNRRGKIPYLPILYFALLLPSAFLTFNDLPLSRARMLVSFSLSGPLALCLSACFFLRAKLTPQQLKQVFLTVIGPAIGVASVSLFYSFEISKEIIYSQSNMDTSGGFGPNQVSAILGMGACLCLLHLMITRAGVWLSALLLPAALYLGTMSAYTFSRGGLYNAGIALLVAAIFFIRSPRMRAKLAVGTATIILIVTFVLLPRLDTVTGGALSARFTNVNTTHRYELGQSDLEVWQDNLLLGVGPGLVRYNRNSERGGSAHTEFTRLLAEHGLLGLIAALTLFVVAAQGMRRKRALMDKAITAALLCWSLAFMLNAGMRIAAPSFIFSLALVTLTPDGLPASKSLLRAQMRRRRLKGQATELTRRRAPGPPSNAAPHPAA